VPSVDRIRRSVGRKPQNDSPNSRLSAAATQLSCTLPIPESGRAFPLSDRMPWSTCLRDCVISVAISTQFVTEVFMKLCTALHQGHFAVTSRRGTMHCCSSVSQTNITS